MDESGVQHGIFEDNCYKHTSDILLDLIDKEVFSSSLEISSP